MPRKLEVTALDFDGIKASLRSFLAAQSEFKDFDFEGAGLSVLLDILAYNTHYSAYYMNMIANEMFMDSAAMRSSVVSIAKHLSYTPRSIKSAEAIVDVTVAPGNSPATVVIARNTSFNTVVDGRTYVFSTDRAYMAAADSDGKFRFKNVRLIEGYPYTYRIVVDNEVYKQRFVIPNPNADTSHIGVRVQTSVTNLLTETYTLANDITEVRGDSKVYFIQEAEEGKCEIYFGDGIVGNRLNHGNIVIIDYFVSNGPDANGCSTFTPSSYVGGYGATNVTVNTVNAAFGGAVAETTEQVRFAAPKNYEMQGRAVTAQDYKTLIARDYPLIESVAVWGGELHNPPEYGKVFISLKPVRNYVITETVKAVVIRDILRKRNIVSVIPEVKDPDYIWILVRTKVKYDPTITDKTSDEIGVLAKAAIESFATDNVGKFDNSMKYSKLVYAIDNSDPSITNNLTTLKIQKRWTPRLNIAQNYVLNFSNSIQPSSIISTQFVIAQDPDIIYVNGDVHRIQDNGSGILQVIKTNNGVDTTVKNIGTVDYNTGEIKINGFMPYSIYNQDQLKLTATPVENDIIPLRNNILLMESADISVSVLINSPLGA